MSPTAADPSPAAPHLALLQRWPRFAERFWYDLPGQAGLGCFGTGFNAWGVQTNQKYLASLAVLATDPATDCSAVGLSRDQMLARALAALRYELATHSGGTLPRTDGSQWGCTWISSLGVERMMHGVDLLNAHLTEDDRAGLRRVLIAECDWLLANYPVASCLWQSAGPNHPESNYWNGAVLLRAATLYGDHANAAAWTEKAHSFLLNAISVPADAQNETVYAGKPVRDWFVGAANFFPNYALDHHSYLNVGYMAICLSNMAMLHYFFASRGLAAPPVIYHHGRDLWQLLRRLIFADGRLARIGGDSRQRYCYCQDYLLPTLVFAADHFADPLAAHLEAGQLELIAREQAANADGSFLSKRLELMARESPYYYTRLESDKAACVSMAAAWRRLRPQMTPVARLPQGAADALELRLAGGWEEPEHGAIFHRSPTRLASWSWRAFDAPQGLCLPPDDGSLAEWSECLAGRVSPLGEVFRKGDGRAQRPLIRSMQKALEGGFVTCGTVTDGAEIVIPEGYKAADLVRHDLAFAALPDGHSCLRLERARLGPRRAYFRDMRGLKLNLANDLFNGGERRVVSAGGPRCFEMETRGEPSVRPLDSLWANVEDKLAVVAIYGAETLSVYSPGRRTAGYMDSLHYNEICMPCRLGPFDAPAGATLLDTGAMVIASIDRGDTRQYAEAGRAAQCVCDCPDARAVVAEGLDGKRYLLAANFVEGGSAVVNVTVASPGAAVVELSTGRTLDVVEGTVALTLAAGAAELYRIE